MWFHSYVKPKNNNKKNTLTNKRKEEQTHRYRDQVTGYQRGRGWQWVKTVIGGKLYCDEWQLDWWRWSPGTTYRRQTKTLRVLCRAQSLSRVQLFGTLGTVAHQAPLSMGFSRQEYWRGLPFPPSGDLPDPGLKPGSLSSPALQVDPLPLSHQESPVMLYI